MVCCFEGTDICDEIFLKVNLFSTELRQTTRFQKLLALCKVCPIHPAAFVASMELIDVIICNAVASLCLFYTVSGLVCVVAAIFLGRMEIGT